MILGVKMEKIGIGVLLMIAIVFQAAMSNAKIEDYFKAKKKFKADYIIKCGYSSDGSTLAKFSLHKIKVFYVNEGILGFGKKCMHGIKIIDYDICRKMISEEQASRSIVCIKIPSLLD